MHAFPELHALVQAGGRGERIRAVAGGRPKPLVELGSVPILERLLARIIDSGISRITVVIGPRGDAIEQHIATLRKSFPSEVCISVERERLPAGNAGALGMVDFAGRPVLLCFGDLVTQLDFRRMCAIHEERECDITLASHIENHQLSLGELVVAGDEVRRYYEKPRKEFLICSGVAIFSPKAIDVARTLPRPFGLVDLVNAALDAGCRVTHWQHGSYWIDVNTPELLDQARRDLEGQIEDQSRKVI
jgi:NDP-sugar pyrophosphorylase family protein